MRELEICVVRLKCMWTNESGGSGEQRYFSNAVVNGVVRASEVDISPTSYVIEVGTSVMRSLQAEGGNMLCEDYRSIIVK